MSTRPNHFTFSLPPTLEERLDAHCKRTGLTKSEVLRNALSEHLDGSCVPRIRSENEELQRLADRARSDLQSFKDRLNRIRQKQ
jgi:Arc/MetJ-type ribon-helix-helix transcriptional regulator